MSKPKKKRILFWIGSIFGILLAVLFNYAIHQTSTNTFCQACHFHPHSTTSWKTSPHSDNPHGVQVDCVECHLPPGGIHYLTAKAITGTRDVWGKLTKKPEDINWEEKSKLEHAIKHTYQESCKKCHQNLFPIGLSQKGENAHLYYDQNQETVNCLNCHLRVGHFSRDEQHTEEYTIEETPPEQIYTKPAEISTFENFTEYVPGTGVSFEMIAIPGGSFAIGSPHDEPLREEDEGPQKNVELSKFFMAKTEVSWKEFDAFYRATATEGRTDTRVTNDDIDGITGPTPPYENPDQSWGRGSRPAITMTFHAAEVYCQWLSQVTGKTYRLPTEAEWEYACRANTTTPFFFKGNPKKYTENSLWNKIFRVDTTGVASFANYKQNSFAKTQPAETAKANPFGLLNMTGNVWEFCQDWYAKDTYANYSDGVQNPQGPASGEEHVIRGGSFKSDAAFLRSASRAHTKHDAWLVTDPQMPKSIWWYSDVKDVGFRVVCEYDN